MGSALAITPGLPHVALYRVLCGCPCGCPVRLVMPGDGEEHYDGALLFEAEMRRLGWGEPGSGPWGARWVCGECVECGSEREAVA